MTSLASQIVLPCCPHEGKSKSYEQNEPIGATSSKREHVHEIMCVVDIKLKKQNDQM